MVVVYNGYVAPIECYAHHNNTQTGKLWDVPHNVINNKINNYT